MDETLETRIETLERAITEGEEDLSALAEAGEIADRLEAVESTLSDLEEQVAELEAGSQALRGYVGNLRSVNRDVEQRADAALAKVESLEATLSEDGSTAGPTPVGRDSTTVEPPSGPPDNSAECTPDRSVSGGGSPGSSTPDNTDVTDGSTHHDGGRQTREANPALKRGAPGTDTETNDGSPTLRLQTDAETVADRCDAGPANPGSDRTGPVARNGNGEKQRPPGGRRDPRVTDSDQSRRRSSGADGHCTECGRPPADETTSDASRPGLSGSGDRRRESSRSRGHERERNPAHHGETDRGRPGTDSEAPTRASRNRANRDGPRQDDGETEGDSGSAPLGTVLETDGEDSPGRIDRIRRLL